MGCLPLAVDRLERGCDEWEECEMRCGGTDSESHENLYLEHR